MSCKEIRPFPLRLVLLIMRFVSVAVKRMDTRSYLVKLKTQFVVTFSSLEPCILTRGAMCNGSIYYNAIFSYKINFQPPQSAQPLAITCGGHVPSYSEQTVVSFMSPSCFLCSGWDACDGRVEVLMLYVVCHNEQYGTFCSFIWFHEWKVCTKRAFKVFRGIYGKTY